MYRQELPVAMNDNSDNCNNPLSWWCHTGMRFKHLSILASRNLSVFAFSAPSERIFSTAGLAISKHRAWLASQTVNELIFLHDVLPAITKFEELCSMEGCINNLRLCVIVCLLYHVSYHGISDLLLSFY